MDVWILDKTNYNDEYSQISEKNLSKFFLSYIFRLKTGAPFDESLLTYGEYGKPLYPNFYYNISHSGNYICLAHSKFDVGIDIEVKRPINPLMVKKIFHPQEFISRELIPQGSHSRRLIAQKLCPQGSIAQKSIPQEPAAQDDILDMWVFKEAYAKYLGQGLFLDFTTILRADIEQRLCVHNLSTRDYFCYVIGKETLSTDHINYLKLSELNYVK